MQITKIQNIVRNNFQYKNNSIKFNSINFQGQDTFEHSITDDVIVSKKYYRGKEEYTPDVFMQSGDRLFIKNKGVYFPYGAYLDEYDEKNELIRKTAFNNGAKFIVSSYEDGKLTQEDKYEDIFARGIDSSKRTCVAKFKTSSTTKKRPEVVFRISRNYGKDWKKHPRIELQKEIKDDIVTIYYSAQSEEKVGQTYIRSKKDPIGVSIPIIDDGIYKFTPKEDSDITLLLEALKELRDTILSEEFKDDFGFSQKFNSELDKTIVILVITNNLQIEFLKSKLSVI